MVYGWQENYLTVNGVAPLRATLKGDRAEAAVTEWLSHFEDGQIERAGERVAAVFEGGMWAVREEPCVITLYSSGEDCFDSLHHYADWLYDMAKHYGGTVAFEQRPYERRPMWLKSK